MLTTGFQAARDLYGTIDAFSLSHGTQVNRESLSAQTKLDTTMSPEGKQGTDKTGRQLV